ncbi:hypothetical protein LTR84_009022 [Exophiala bonariae]|uniref:AB hydrolase-1 domain-containing protein n=1 Tax=Exophiala bonariae TaxID=1690606 RepID=A0AAV9MYK9_9EURO|nr:hypothetical protein LTR84_009022 [Exophiala bonariae]
MLRSIFAIALALAARLVSAKHCQNLTIPVTISAQNAVWNITAPSNNVEVTNFILDVNRQGHSYIADAFKGGTYNIGTTYCAPDHGHSKVIQILTHGGGFDRNYWDLSFNNFNYSYVNVAVDEYGFSTLTWDRIGVGESDHPDPIQDVQAALSEQALRYLTEQIHNGTFPGVEHEFEKVQHVGHSIGSGLTLSLIRDYPTISDAAVLTGFSANGTWADQFMFGSSWLSTTEIPRYQKDYPAGYIAWEYPSGIQTAFLAPGNFDPEALPWSVNNTKPTSIGEIVQVGSPVRNNFTGPLLIITGERDLVFCGGDCYQIGNPAVPSILNLSTILAPDAQLETIVVPGSGHGLNMEYSHKQTYADINKFLQNH